MKKIKSVRRWGLLWGNNLMAVYWTRAAAQNDMWSVKHSVVRVDVSYEIPKPKKP